MKKTLTRFIFPALFLAAFLFGCASKPLYYWGNYESQMHAFLKGESQATQISEMEKDLAKMRGKGTGDDSGVKAPPGFYAYLGMLYAEAGDTARAVTCFETEKENFPESAAFMDYFLNNLGGKK